MCVHLLAAVMLAANESDRIPGDQQVKG